MRILAFVEGASEAGSAGERHGAIDILVRKLLGNDVTVELMLTRNSRHGRGPGGTWLKKAIAAMDMAEGRGFDALIFLIDLDEVRKRGVTAQLDEAQASPRRRIRRAMGVAIMEFEAWLLADEVAIAKGVHDHDGTSIRVDPQPDPETTKDAKAALEAIVGDRPKRGLYPQIVRHLRVDHVAKRCPKGFGVFQKRVLALRVATP